MHDYQKAIEGEITTKKPIKSVALLMLESVLERNQEEEPENAIPSWAFRDLESTATQLKGELAEWNGGSVEGFDKETEKQQLYAGLEYLLRDWRIVDPAKTDILRRFGKYIDKIQAGEKVI